jgi:hypothetical protein
MHSQCTYFLALQDYAFRMYITLLFDASQYIKLKKDQIYGLKLIIYGHSFNEYLDLMYGTLFVLLY